MIGVNDSTLEILQDRLENTITILRVILRHTSRRHYDDNPADRTEYYIEEEPYSERETEGNWREGDNTYLVGKIVQHVGSGFRLRNVLQKYGYSKAGNTAKPQPHSPTHY